MSYPQPLKEPHWRIRKKYRRRGFCWGTAFGISVTLIGLSILLRVLG